MTSELRQWLFSQRSIIWFVGPRSDRFKTLLVIWLASLIGFYYVGWSQRAATEEHKATQAIQAGADLYARYLTTAKESLHHDATTRTPRDP